MILKINSLGFNKDPKDTLVIVAMFGPIKAPIILANNINDIILGANSFLTLSAAANLY